MLYRRTPRNPPTLLLRIVAAAGASTVLGIASCGGETHTNGPGPLMGSVPGEVSDAQVDDGSTLMGAVDSAGIAPFPGDDAEPLGLVVNPEGPDASVHGVAPLPEDAGTDAHGILMGSVVEPPDAGHDSGSTHSCPPLCGVVIGIGPNPGH